MHRDHREDPRGAFAVSLSQNLCGWVLHHPRRQRAGRPHSQERPHKSYITRKSNADKGRSSTFLSTFIRVRRRSIVHVGYGACRRKRRFILPVVPEYVRGRQAETRQQIAAGQQVMFQEQLDICIGTIDFHDTFLGIDKPPIREPLAR